MDPDEPTRNRTGIPSPSILARRGMMAGLIFLVAIIALFAILIAMSPPAAAPAVTPPTTAATTESGSPMVELFVMCFCPYGTEAETAMEPVVNLLGTKANITVRYIAGVQGTTVSSLHGPAEAQEDLRQLCINRYYRGQFWQYLSTFNRDCYPNWQNATYLDTCRGNTLQALGIDAKRIEACATGAEGLGLLTADEQATSQYNVQGSPTLIINGQVYDGDRTPEAYKEAICSHFNTPPAECGINLSAQQTAAPGGCG
jgi:hypothetical protein